jgi:hypothetical protein
MFSVVVRSTPAQRRVWLDEVEDEVEALTDKAFPASIHGSAG